VPVIQNPILPGFFPDPSICRVGDDYYLASSTFEWFPGVPIHHSRDLANWRLIGHALTRPAQVDLRGVPDSAGVWAPSLSHADGQFWLVYTNLRNTGMGRPFKDIGIYLTTATDIRGPWSDPVTLNSIGFDPSLFHDDDGRKWLVNMIWDYRKDRYRFAGIVVQEYDHRQRKLVGPMSKILEKNRILTEGPNFYKHDGWYYLMLAEGGTGWGHGISMARAKNITGPYELDPQASVLTSRDDASLPLQKAGHGEIVRTQSGEWYLAHLASRPLATGAPLNAGSPDKSEAAAQHIGHRCILGRETCLQKVEWRDGWLRLATGGIRPQVEIPAPKNLPPHPWPAGPERDDFNSETPDPRWSSLRVPMDESWCSLKARPGWLRLRGRDSQHSLFYQSLVTRRLQHFHATVETCLEFSPGHYTHSAGLICYYDTRTHFYLRVSHDAEIGKILGITLTDDTVYDELTQIAINDWQKVFLRAEIDHARLQFSASPDGKSWHKIGPVLDASKLSDDYGSALHFTGAMIGLCCQDLKDQALCADFDYFDYRPVKN
jgi:xylan 1,4-beta-xylosidase